MPDIDFQRIELNLIPKKGEQPVVFYASQYETARPFIADLKWGNTEFAPGDDCRAEIDIRKNDDNLVVITDDVTIDNNEVSVILPVQALTCIGKNLGQVKIYAADDHLIAALNFILEVQADPLAGGVTSETAIDNLTQQIEDIAQEVIGDDYYNKTEVDTLLADKADVSDLPDMSQYYTKTATDTLLNAKADKSDTYTKAQVDTALAAKANTADLATVATSGDYDDLINKPTIPAAQIQSDYTQADTTAVDYIKNKPDISGMIDAAIFDILPIATTAKSSSITFNTEIAAPVQSAVCYFRPSGGNGQPNDPVPIGGYSSETITANGVPVTVSFGDTYYGGILDVKTGVLTITYGYVTYDGSEAWINVGGDYPFAFQIDTYISNRVTVPLEEQDIVCNLFPQATSDVPSENAIRWQVSGGPNGRMFVYDYTHVNDLPGFLQMLNNTNMQIAYNLVEPFTVQITPETINAIVGSNTVSCSAGEIQLSYKDSIQHYIDNQ